MNLLVALLFPLVAGDGGETIRRGETARLPEVSGVIATHVRFKEAARKRVAEACLALLASCTYAHVPNEGEMPEWDTTFLDVLYKKAHLYIRLPKPRAIQIATSEKIEVSELLIVLPLNNGTIWVRAGDKAKRFGKYSPNEAVHLQRLLKEAEPVE